MKLTVVILADYMQVIENRIESGNFEPCGCGLMNWFRK